MPISKTSWRLLASFASRRIASAANKSASPSSLGRSARWNATPLPVAPSAAAEPDAMSIDAVVRDHFAHFLLYSEARLDAEGGHWRFVLTQVGANSSLTAADIEAEACRERLELLAVVRGLEAIDQPARVTLVTGSRYVSRGLKRGLAEWRLNDWQWERFGQQVAVRDCDLWRRVDRALEFHKVDCRLWHLDSHVETLGEARDVHGSATAGQRLAAAAKARWRQAARAAASWGEALQGVGISAG